MQTEKKYNSYILGVVVPMIFLACFSWVAADEYYAGGITVDIDYDVLGYIWVEDATVNLYDGAHIITTDAFYGDILATSGAVINVYGGTVDGIVFVTTGSEEFEEAQVTVYGTDFAVDGVPVDPAVTEVYLQQQELSGFYGSGEPFVHYVDCSESQTTIKLAWLIEEPTPAEKIDMIAVYYELAFEDGSIEPLQNGNGQRFTQGNAVPLDKQLMLVQQLIYTGEYADGLDVLEMIEKKCDGQTSPRDFITGEGVTLLNEMINELIDMLLIELESE